MPRARTGDASQIDEADLARIGPLLGALVDALATAVAAKLESHRAERAPEEPRYYSAVDNPLGSSRAFLDAARRGAFPTYRPGKMLLALRSDVHAWIERCPVQRAAPPVTHAPQGADVTNKELLRRSGIHLSPPAQVEHSDTRRRRRARS